MGGRFCFGPQRISASLPSIFFDFLTIKGSTVVTEQPKIALGQNVI